MHDHFDLLESLLHVPFGGGHQAAGQKVAAEDASYTSPGPDPFICANCCYHIFRDGEIVCQIVHGPGNDGAVDHADTCRFWQSTPARVTLAPISGLMEPPQRSPQSDTYEPGGSGADNSGDYAHD